MTSDASIAIQLKDISMQFGKKTILQNIHLNILRGEIFGLLGPNGAGKSTLISIIAGILKPTSGSVSIHGLDTFKYHRDHRIGYIPQEISLFQSLSVQDNLAFWANLYRLSDKKKKIDEVIDFFQLNALSKQPVYTLSSGMKRRLNLGVALLHNPDIMLMDEPTVGIDLSSRTLILNRILALKKLGKTFLFTTHHPDEPYKICDKIGMLKDKTIQYTGRLENVLQFYQLKSIEQLMA